MIELTLKINDESRINIERTNVGEREREGGGQQNASPPFSHIFATIAHVTLYLNEPQNRPTL